MTTRIPRGIKNNNPGNIRKTDIDWKGEIEGSDEAFETFESPVMGIRAMMKCLLNYQKRMSPLTINKLITTWAPPSENDCFSYINHVCKLTGAEPDDVVDMRERAWAIPICRAIVTHENGQQPYGPEIYVQAADEAGLI